MKAEEEAIDITQTNYPKKAEELADNIEYEKNKRSKFQYNITENAKKSYAKTSIDRATEFIETIELVIKQ